MKVVILAGGWGSRLGNYTEFIPKPMLRIGTQPIIWHIMKIYAHYGYKDFVICIGVKGNVIKDYFANYDVENYDFQINLATRKTQFLNRPDGDAWTVTLVDTGINTLKGGRIKRVEKYLDPGMNLLTYGDGLSDVNIQELVRFHKSHGKLLTLTGVIPVGRFGEISEKDGVVMSFKEKPKESAALINGGFMVFNNEMLKYLTTREDCEFEIGPLEQMADEGQVMVYKHRGFWACMDHERDYNYLNDLWNKNNAQWKCWTP